MHAAEPMLEILKQPLHTSIAIDPMDFEDFIVEEKVHIGISVKDFKAIVSHAETFKSSITALYSHPTKPLKMTYGEYGVQCDFILMTTGEYRGASMTPVSTTTRDRSSRPVVGREVPHPLPQERSQPSSEAMAPPVQPASRNFVREPSSQRPTRPSPPLPKASVDHNSLFITDDDDESKWGEKSYEDDKDELGWAASADQVRS